jgi:superfamily II DNA or RNA helicase
MINLRDWQQKALEKALQWLTIDRTDKHFLINAAPGAGKTIASCVIANELFEQGEIDRVIVIAPRREVVRQWSNDFEQVTGRYMAKVTAADSDDLETDVCATWQALSKLQDAMQSICLASNVLVICDEIHHAAVEAAWGESATSGFADAKFVLVLTGTPIRSDGAQTVWMAYDSVGAIDHPEGGSYTLTYGQAVDLGYCRPTTFHRHKGEFQVEFDQGQSITVSGEQPSVLPEGIERVPGIETALNFYKLACTPQYELDNVTPKLNGFQATMVEWAGNKLTELRHRMLNAGGLVIAPNIKMAEYMVNVIELLEGEKPLIVHSDLPNSDAKINQFRRTKKRWLVSVGMVTEGVDIKRLRVLLYLPNALTELAFRQANGRVVRTSGPKDDTRAYVVMPSFDTFEMYARRVEDEMPVSARREQPHPRTKVCPGCHAECPINATECADCGHEFASSTPNPPRMKPCHECSALNMLSAEICTTCGASFGHRYTISLKEALRDGAIIRGMDLDEGEVKEGEEIAPGMRHRILKSGDEKLIQIVKLLPDESWGRLKGMLSG